MREIVSRSTFSGFSCDQVSGRQAKTRIKKQTSRADLCIVSSRVEINRGLYNWPCAVDCRGNVKLFQGVAAFESRAGELLVLLQARFFAFLFGVYRIKHVVAEAVTPIVTMLAKIKIDLGGLR